MCTAVTYQTREFFYFGRTLDHTESYGEAITVTPRRYPFYVRSAETIQDHFAVIGTAHVSSGYPLYYDAVNEKGLAMAGLHFLHSAVYRQPQPDRTNLAVFELIPWILGCCASVREARTALEQINLTTEPFCRDLPPAPLHWLLADRQGAVVIEPTAEGLMVHDDPVGVLTNEPPFPMQLQHLNNYRHLSPRTGESVFAPGLDLPVYSRGMGAMGLPGDWSSQSRFVRAAFARGNAPSHSSEADSVGQVFQILGSVAQPRGCCEVEPGQYETTRYAAVCNADKGIYYYTTEENHQITAVDLHRENLDGTTLAQYPLRRREAVLFEQQSPQPKG